MSAATTRITSTIGTAANPVPITLDDDLLSLADVRSLIAADVFFFETAIFFTSSSNSGFSISFSSS